MCDDQASATLNLVQAENIPSGVPVQYTLARSALWVVGCAGVLHGVLS